MMECVLAASPNLQGVWGPHGALPKPVSIKYALGNHWGLRHCLPPAPGSIYDPPAGTYCKPLQALTKQMRHLRTQELHHHKVTITHNNNDY